MIIILHDYITAYYYYIRLQTTYLLFGKGMLQNLDYHRVKVNQQTKLIYASSICNTLGRIGNTKFLQILVEKKKKSIKIVFNI